MTAKETGPHRRPERRQKSGRPPLPSSLITTSGPEPDETPEGVRLVVGVIVGAHGVTGELKLKLLTDDPAHLANIQHVFVDEEPHARRLQAFRMYGELALIRLSDVTTKDDADALRGRIIKIAGKDAKPLAPDEFFLYQVIGLRVENEAGESFGIVSDFLEAGSNGVFAITIEGETAPLLLPNHPDVILDIRPDERRMVVRPLVYDE